MFPLTDASLERIIFAMEDQSNELLIDLETGDLIEKTKYSEENPDSVSERYVEPPSWDSRRGFTILEAFAATIASPPELKLALNAALRRGKGVFRAFRQALSNDAALSRRFQDFKLRAMRPVVEEWLGTLQEERRLATLKEEPEDIGDIAASEIEFKISPFKDIPFRLETFLTDYAQEGFSSLPAGIHSWSLSSLLERIRASKESIFISFATIDGINPLMFGIFMLQTPNALPLCTVEGIFGSRESAMLSIEWPLIDTIAAYALTIGAPLMVLEGPFFPSPIFEEASAHGFVQSGSVFYKTL
jgi:hypothetical protein